VIPKRYLIATLFIAAMLVILAVVQARKPAREGGAFSTETPTALVLESYETLAEFRLQDGWAPRFQGALDPDQPEPWPFTGGFGAPWEPASPYLADQGLALNGPGDRSEVVLWRGLEWRRYRFDAPLCSARLDPAKGNRLLVTLKLGASRFETRLLEVPEGRVLWASDSGPWSRFSWDGHAVLLGLKAPSPEGALLLTTLPVDADLPPATLASWDETELPPPPKGWPVKPEQLWADGEDLRGARLLVPWSDDGRMWFPRRDRLWVSGGGSWCLWGLHSGIWVREDAGAGVLDAHPPIAMGRISPGTGDKAARFLAPLNAAEWREIPAEDAPWPAFDPCWTWLEERAACSAWDQRWGQGKEPIPLDRQREALGRAFSAEWRVASGLRASVRGWLPGGPEIAMRETLETGWVWVGDRVCLVRLQPSDRLRKLKALLRLK
jgi:hypothetical protein